MKHYIYPTLVSIALLVTFFVGYNEGQHDGKASRRDSRAISVKLTPIERCAAQVVAIGAFDDECKGIAEDDERLEPAFQAAAKGSTRAICFKVEKIIPWNCLHPDVKAFYNNDELSYYSRQIELGGNTK